MNAAAALADLAARYWAFERIENGLGAFLAGDDAGEPVLFRESAADYVRREHVAGDFLGELDQIPRDRLDAKDAATHSLLQRELRLIRDNFALDAHLRPSLLPVGPDFNTVFFANAVTLTDAAAADLYVDRLSRFPAFLGDVRANLLEGHARGIRYPRIVLEAASRNTSAIAGAAPEASPWFAPFAKSPIAGSPQLARAVEQALSIIAEHLIPALRAHADLIAGPLMEGARETVSCRHGPGGGGWYALLVRQFTTTDMVADEIHALGLAEVSRIEAAMAALAGESGFGDDLPGYRHFLTTDPQFIAADSDVLRERVEILCKRIDAKIPAYFSRIPRITYGVDVAPAAMSASLPPAYAQPAPSGGASAGIFWVNGLVEKCPTYILPAMAVHEAWPGHLMHIGRLEMEMWRACRLVVDTGIHAFDWPRERAIAYLSDHLSLSPETIAAEVDRYIALPGQALAYHIGGLRVRAMRERAEKALNSRFSLRAFHEKVMTAGPATLPVLDDIVDAWIAEAA
jgi:uncharacterized protein (DUF885 family)